MIRLQPSLHIGAQTFCQGDHFASFLVRNRAGSFVATDITLFAELFELDDKRVFRSERESQGLNDAIVMGLTASAISCSGQGGRRDLKGGVVGNGQSPVGAEARDLAIR